MAKRKTIGDNPLDPIMPDQVMRPTEAITQPEKPSRNPVSSAKANRSSRQAPAAPESTKRTTSPSPSSAKTGAQAPSPTELIDRIKSLEQQTYYIEWLVGGAILIALLL